MLLYQFLAFIIDGKYKNNNNNNKFKYQLQLGTKKLNYLTDRILYQIFKIISSMS